MQDCGAINLGSTVQIESDLLSHALISIELFRYAYGTSTIISTRNIRNGSYANGIRLLRGNLTDNYWMISISASGLLLVQSTSTSTEAPNIVLHGLL